MATLIMLSILSTLNLCGSVDDVRDDVVVATENSPQQQPDIILDDKRKTQSLSSFSCSGAPCQKYVVDDQVEPLLPADVILQSLRGTVPDLIKCISSAEPTFPDQTPAKARKKAIREYNTKRTQALQKLHELTKNKKEQYRAPLVCNQEEWDVIGVLTNALLASITNVDERTPATKGKDKPSMDEDRRLICWSLNNLSVPYENKAILALGEHSAKLLQGLTMVIQSNLPETYLCCICLLNLTYLADTIRPITLYVPSCTGKPPYSPSKRSRSASLLRRPAALSRHHSSSNNDMLSSMYTPSKLRSFRSKSPVRRIWSENEARMSEICSHVLGNPSSLIRVVERMMMTNAPFLLSNAQSVQGESIRWSCGFFRNITFASSKPSNIEEDGSDKGDDNMSGSTGRQGSISNESIEELCLLLSQTEIPRLMVQFVKDSPRPAIQWTKDSLEDVCLGSMCNMAQFQSTQEALRRAHAVECLEKIEKLPGIHGYRARAIRCSLGSLPKHFG